MTRIHELRATTNLKGGFRCFDAPLKHAPQPEAVGPAEAFFGHRLHESSSIAFEMNPCHLAHGIGDHFLFSNDRPEHVSLSVRSCFNEPLRSKTAQYGLHGSLSDPSIGRQTGVNLSDGSLSQLPDHT